MFFPFLFTLGKLWAVCRKKDDEEEWKNERGWEMGHLPTKSHSFSPFPPLSLGVTPPLPPSSRSLFLLRVVSFNGTFEGREMRSLCVCNSLNTLVNQGKMTRLDKSLFQILWSDFTRWASFRLSFLRFLSIPTNCWFEGSFLFPSSTSLTTNAEDHRWWWFRSLIKWQF